MASKKKDPSSSTPPEDDTSGSAPGPEEEEDDLPPAFRVGPSLASRLPPEEVRAVTSQESNLRRVRRPTPAERTAQWQTWAESENARQAKAKEDAAREAYERARAEHAGRPWPPEPA
jgi:hypothetical protein